MENTTKKHKPDEFLPNRSEEPVKFKTDGLGSLRDFRYYRVRKDLDPSPQGLTAKFQFFKGETFEIMFLENIEGFEEYRIHIEDLAGNSVFWDIKLVNLYTVIKVTEPGRYEPFQKLRSCGKIPLYLCPPEADPTLLSNGNPDFYFGRSALEYTKSVCSTIKGPINITVTVKNPVPVLGATLCIHVVSPI